MRSSSVSKVPVLSGKNGKTMIRLSLATALLMPIAETAWAQLAVNCTQALRFATIAACGGGGTLRVTAKSGKTTDLGCIIPLGAAKRAVCTVKSFATSGSLQVKVTAKSMKIGGPASMSVKNFNIGTAAGGPTKTYASVSLTATPLTFGVGGSRLATGGQTTGNYSGQLVMTVMFTP
ncbi:MAG: hypothetical protein CO093_06635 [Alphaproteobacteria bacterium CG_4_9_14_3_um_filter_47_13]|nr:MAG: hypothetical protein CO093_06635 [Alphaproteobacteria bacterium CG_4_9_14_3_um_filter_47_13]